MKVPRSFRSPHALCCLAGATGALAIGALAAEPADYLEGELIQDRNRLSVAARFSFGITARVHNRASPEKLGPDYLDGFVRPDINGGADGQTWYWSYQAASQLADGHLELHRLAGLPSDELTGKSGDDVQAGFEVVYGRELGRFRLAGRTAAWGVELGISSLNPKLETRDRYSGTAQLRTDRFDLHGILPPGAPYTGTFDGPGPLLDLAPALSRLEAVPAVSEVRTTLDTLLVGAKLGPFLEVPLGARLQLNFSAGVAALGAFSDFKYTETVQVSGLSPGYTQRGEASRDTFEVGGYAQLSLTYALTDFLSVFAGGQYLYLNDLETRAASKVVTLESSGAFEAVVGLRTSF